MFLLIIIKNRDRKAESEIDCSTEASFNMGGGRLKPRLYTWQCNALPKWVISLALLFTSFPAYFQISLDLAKVGALQTLLKILNPDSWMEKWREMHLLCASTGIEVLKCLKLSLHFLKYKATGGPRRLFLASLAMVSLSSFLLASFHVAKVGYYWVYYSFWPHYTIWMCLLLPNLYASCFFSDAFGWMPCVVWLWVIVFPIRIIKLTWFCWPWLNGASDYDVKNIPSSSPVYLPRS